MIYDASSQTVLGRVAVVGPPGSGVTTALRVWSRAFGMVPATTSLRTRGSSPLVRLELDREAPIRGGRPRVDLIRPLLGPAGSVRDVDGLLVFLDGRPASEATNQTMAQQVLRLVEEQKARVAVVVVATHQDGPGAIDGQTLTGRHFPNQTWPVIAAVPPLGVGLPEALRLLMSLLRDGQVAPTTTTTTEDWSEGWLLNCWSCHNLSDVPLAEVGHVVSCPVCGAGMEVVDPDRGLTRAAVVGTGRRRRPAGPVMPGAGVADLTPPRGPGLVQSAPPGSTSAHRRPHPAQSPNLTILQELERDVVGSRHRVRDEEAGRTHRCLRIAPSLLARPGYRQALEEQVRIAAGVRHDHLLPVVGLRTWGSDLLLLSDPAVDYESLDRVLSRRRTLPSTEALAILRQVAMALEEGVRRGVVHGWLRPEAVLVDPTGLVLVDDLALAPQPTHQLEITGATEEVEHWVAPEAVMGPSGTSSRGMIFLLGALLLRMVGGQAQVMGRDPHVALRRLLAQGPVLLRDVAPQVSPLVADLHERLVDQVHADHRFTTLGAVITAIDRCLASLPPPTTRQIRRTPLPLPMVPPPVVPRTSAIRAPTRAVARPRSPGVPVLPVVLVVVVVLAAAVVVLALVLRRPAPASAKASSAPAAAEPAAATPVLVTPPLPVPRPPSSPARTESTAPELPVQPLPTPDEVVLRREQVARIGDLIVAERFSDALQAIDGLADPEQQEAQRRAVTEAHRQRQKEIVALVERGAAVPVVQEALVPARTLWGLPDAEEWAAGILARARDAAAPPVPAAAVPPPAPATDAAPALPSAPEAAAPAPSPTAATPAPEAPSLPDVVLEPADQAFLDVARRLREGRPAEGALGGITDQFLRADLEALAAWWETRWSLFQAVVGQPGVRLRLTHPVTGLLSDVTGTSPDEITTEASTGAISHVPWSQIPLREQARLVMESSNVRGGTIEDVLPSLAGHVLADEAPLAVLDLRRIREQLPAETLATAERLIARAQRTQILVALQKAREALRTRQPKALTDAQADLARWPRAQLLGREDVAEAVQLALRQPGAGSADPAVASLAMGQEGLRLLGWEPQGPARLEGATIVIPAGAAITAPIPAGCLGYTVHLCGSPGFLKVQVLRRGATPGTAGLLIPIPTDPATSTIRLTRDAATLLDRQGEPVDQIRVGGVPAQILLRTTAEVRLHPLPQALMPGP